MYPEHFLRKMLRAGILLCALFFPSVAALAQATGTITADPNAETLRPIWQVKGSRINERVGTWVAGLGDLFGRGRGAWAVLSGNPQQWLFYRNDNDSIGAVTSPFKRISSNGLNPPLAGDYWGHGQKGLVVFTATLHTSGGVSKYFQEIYAFRAESDTISGSVATMMNTWTMNPPMTIGLNPYGVYAADLDHDGADELILSLNGIGSDTSTNPTPQVWIFKGGPEFRLDAPTIVARDTRGNDSLVWKTAIGDFDGDGHIDILRAGGNWREFLAPSRMTFYWGDGTLAGYADTNNRRTVELTGDFPYPAFGVTSLDCDGDGVLDLAIDQRNNPSRGTYLFRSGSGKNARSRSYRREDADIVFPDLMAHYSGGYINDSSRRYQMLLLGTIEGQGGYPNRMFFAGGERGPDLAYDAVSNHGGRPIFDVDGDGWDDFIAGIPDSNFAYGVAVIYAGGPYIPSSKVSGVEAIAGEGHQQAITIWPNPLRDDLHIAWRGDLRCSPRGFRVHDLLGREVAHGTVPADAKAALWHSGDLPGGMYLLSVLAHDGTILTTTGIIKQ